jgi:hypothetical protein
MDMIVPLKTKGLKLFPRQLKLLLPKDMIIPQGKYKLSCSPRQLKFLLLKEESCP